MKKVYNNFIGGISYYDRNAPDNQYYEGIEIDPHRGGGYLQPGWLLGTVNTTGVVNARISDILVDPGTNDAYFCDDDRLYHMTSILTEAWDADFDGGANKYYAIGTSNQVYKLATYAVSGTTYLLYAWRNTGTSGDVGIHTLGSNTFNDNYLSTDVGTGNAALADAPIDMMEWKTYMYIGHGQYVGRFDGANDTWDATKLNLGADWEVTKLFPTQNYIGICAWKKHTSGSSYRTESRVFFWDGTSDNYTYWIPVEDNTILNAFNNNGEILLLTYGRDFAVTLRRLTDKGTEKIRKFKTSIAGTSTAFGPTTVGSRFGMDGFGNRVLAGVKYLVWSYGGEEEGQPKAITIPWGQAAVVSSEIPVIKTVLYNKVFISYADHTNSKYYILKANTGNSTRATYRGGYTDFGQKVRVNYVKFYYKPLVASDSVTPTLDVDYGTSWTLSDPKGNATITYTNDATDNLTSKKFNVKRDCHAFRPVIDWGAGGVAFSKIVVDYDFIED